MYDQQAGSSASVEGESPVDFFFLADQQLHAPTHTNLYAQQFYKSHELGPHSRVWLMGLVCYPQIEHHWSLQWPHSTAHFSSVSNL